MSLLATVDQQSLVKLLTQVVTAARKKNSIPVLRTVRLEVSEKGLSATATDLEMVIEQTIPGAGDAPGTVCVDARQILQILRLVPKGTSVTLASARDLSRSFLVEWGNSRYTLQGLAPETFPEVPVPSDGAVSFNISPASLRRLLRRTLWAASKDESKPWVTGVQLKLKSGKATCLSTDGTCLSWASENILGGPAEEEYRIVPGPTVKELINLLPAVTSDLVRVTYDNQRLYVDLGNTRLISRLLEGQYPDIMRLVPQTYPISAKLERKPALEAIRRLMVVAKDGAFKMEAFKLAEVMEFSINTPEVGRAVEVFPDVQVSEDLSVGFNGTFFSKFLPLWDAPHISGLFGGGRNPARFVPSFEAGDPNAEDYGAVVFPLITY